MFFPGTPNVFVPSDSVFISLKCMCNNISIEKKKLNKEVQIHLPVSSEKKTLHFMTSANKTKLIKESIAILYCA